MPYVKVQFVVAVCILVSAESRFDVSDWILGYFNTVKPVISNTHLTRQPAISDIHTTVPSMIFS